MTLRHFLTFICFNYLVFPSIFGQPFPNRHSTTMDDSWLSCELKASPNPSRKDGHWIQYDLGKTHELTQSHWWNFNTPERINSFDNEVWSLVELPGKLEDGMNLIAIDLSTDGINWIEWGSFELPKGPGSSFYEGVAGPDFDGAKARYVLVTAISNHGGPCYGLGEIKIYGELATPSHSNNLPKKAGLLLSPNPTSMYASLTLHDFPEGNIQITARNSIGSVILTKTLTMNKANMSYLISTVDWPSGLYFLSASHADGTKTIKMEVVK